MKNIGQAFINTLSTQGVDVIFGIPGVHTVELYRGLAGSNIRHVTPRHEQGAGFMADGYARASGRPGVAFVITGPGLTNTITAMGQARADSVPILIVSSENPLGQLRQGKGLLHELPDQHGIAKLVALDAFQITSAQDVITSIEKTFDRFAHKRPGPVHIEIPLDITPQDFGSADIAITTRTHAAPDPDQISTAINHLKSVKAPVIIAGGGAKAASQAIKTIAEKLNAPVVQTVNARGVLHNHPLSVPASPSLNSVRSLIENADLVLALGTEFGQTDFDMYATDTMPAMQTLIRVDICPDQIKTTANAMSITGDVETVLPAINDAINAAINAEMPDVNHANDGAARAKETRDMAFEEIGEDMRRLTHFLNEMRAACPQAIMVGDSAQPLYAGNLYYDHDRPAGWFNAATGYGALGYAIPAAIGAAIAKPDDHVICITGDGGAQFSLSELMVARQENLNISFVIWNNFGYQEIQTSMEAVDVEPIGCDPTPPDFEALAQSFGIPFDRCRPDDGGIQSALTRAKETDGPVMIEVVDSR